MHIHCCNIVILICFMRPIYGMLFLFNYQPPSVNGEIYVFWVRWCGYHFYWRAEENQWRQHLPLFEKCIKTLRLSLHSAWAITREERFCDYHVFWKWPRRKHWTENVNYFVMRLCLHSPDTGHNRYMCHFRVVSIEAEISEIFNLK